MLLLLHVALAVVPDSHLRTLAVGADGVISAGHAAHGHGDEQVEKTAPTLVVMGAARNNAKHNDADVATIQRVAKDFELLRVIVFEDDSTDNTVEQLHAWEASLGVTVDVVSESHVTGSRTERLAHARNKLWETVRSTPTSPDYVLMLDFDGVNDNLEGVNRCQELPTGWGGCCANQRTTYYDLWALRTYDHWVDCDVWNGCPGRTDGRWRHITSDASPIKVRSCFGGATLYNYAQVNTDATYAGAVDGHNVCEHVSFHEQLGAPMFIQPAMLNDAPPEHLRHAPINPPILNDTNTD